MACLNRFLSPSHKLGIILTDNRKVAEVMSRVAMESWHGFINQRNGTESRPKSERKVLLLRLFKAGCPAYGGIVQNCARQDRRQENCIRRFVGKKV